MSRYKGRLELEGEAHARAMDELRRAFPELDPDDPFFIDTLDGMTNFTEMVAAVVERYRHLLADAAGLRAQAEAYAAPLIARAERFEESAEVAKNRLERVMIAIDQKTMKEATFDLVVAKSGNPPVEVFDRSFLPEKYLRPAAEREPDKNAIRAALKDPALAEEVELAARIGNAAPRLQIKLK